jgi:hypothetical protein
MKLLNETLATRAKDQDTGALFSVLFSDIGPKFYAARGWKAYESAHLKFTVDASAEYAVPEGVRAIHEDDIAALTQLDEELLRKRLATPASSDARIKVAIVPDEDHMLWHIARQVLASEALYPGKQPPHVHGAQVTLSGTRIWALWHRKLKSADDETKNKLYFLRFVIEDPDAVSDEDLGVAFEKIISAAKLEAKASKCASVIMWSPEVRLKRLVEERDSLAAAYVVRDNDSIISLSWFGEGSVDDVDFMIPEQYTWC